MTIESNREHGRPYPDGWLFRTDAGMVVATYFRGIITFGRNSLGQHQARDIAEAARIVAREYPTA